MQFSDVSELGSLQEIFLLKDKEIRCQACFKAKLLTIPFDDEKWQQELKKYHTACTETTPYQYFGLGFSVAKNYHTLKWYSKDGEADLEGDNIHLLKYYLPDGSYIFIRSDFHAKLFYMLIRAVDEDISEVQTKISEMEGTLLSFLSTI